jgi:hypothetical protein
VKVQLVGHPGQVRQRSGFHLSHDLAAMDFTSDLADADLVGDLLVEAASHDQPRSAAVSAGPGSAGAAIKNPAAIAPSLSHLRCRAFVSHLPVNECEDCSPARAAGGNDSGRGLNRWSIHFWQKREKSKRL